MTVTLDEDTTTIILDRLDFVPACEFPGAAEHAGSKAIRCRACGASAILCDKHLARLRRKTRGCILTCIHCEERRNSFDALIEVVSL